MLRSTDGCGGVKRFAWAAVLTLVASASQAQYLGSQGGGSGGSYTAGSGITISSNAISVNAAQTLTSLLVTSTSTVTPAYGFGAAANNSGFGSSNGYDVYYIRAGSAQSYFSFSRITQAASGAYGFAPSTDPSAAADTAIVRDAANTLALRNSTNANRYNVYAAYTDASDYCRAYLDAGQTTAGVFAIGSEHAGTCGGGGAMTKFGVYVDGALEADWGKTTASTWTFAGSLNIATGYAVGGTAGLASKTCTISALGATITIVGGIVTATTGC